MGFYSIVLAAGEGKRMKSTKAKPLHSICGKPMIDWVISAVQNAGSTDNVIVIGYEGEQISKHCGGGEAPAGKSPRDSGLTDSNICTIKYAVQEEQRGTGHAVMQGIKSLEGKDGSVLVICGDTPLIKSETLAKAFEFHISSSNAATVLTTVAPNPTGYGRIINSSNNVCKIVEEKDASTEEKSISCVNSGIYFFDIAKLNIALSRLTSNNAQGEYYLTDTIEILCNMGEKIGAFDTDFEETMGINDRIQLAEAGGILRQRLLNEHMLNGVTIVDPDTTYIECDVQIGMDTVIYPHTYIHSDTVIGENTSVGPFAYIRPHSRIGSNVKVGDFVEIKNSSVGDNTKISHLTYIGDAEIGSRVNFGCGTVVVNYDGAKKHRTVIEDDAFIGCNTNLVSPVRIKRGAYTAAGSTITDDVPEWSLAVARMRQEVKENWVQKKGRKK